MLLQFFMQDIKTIMAIALPNDNPSYKTFCLWPQVKPHCMYDEAFNKFCNFFIPRMQFNSLVSRHAEVFMSAKKAVENINWPFLALPAKDFIFLVG